MTASPTPFFAESAGETDHSPDAGNMVSAAVPSEEEIARVLATALRQEVIPDTAWAGLVASFRELEAKFPDYAEGYSTSTDAFRQARAVLALFAPVLAEKEREIEQIKATRDSYYRTIEAQGRENSAYLDHWQFAEARALAAEAALATERALRKRLERRIHCQRISNRDNWMIVEQRGKSLRSAALHYIRRGRAIFDAGYEAGKAAIRSQEQP